LRPRPGVAARWGAAAGALILAAITLQAALAASAFPVRELATRTPRATAFMRQRDAEFRRAGRRLAIDQRWIPYERVSPLLRRAVLVAEDDAFFTHGGLDWNEIQASARRNLEAGRIVRGGSTITQQLARNLYLGEERTLSRKLKEAFLALRIERALSKRRIFELYLNLIEWGDGIYGAEAAAQRYFGVSAADLGPREAVLLAAVIINPRRYSPLDPGRRIQRRVRLIAARLRRRGDLDEDGYRLAIAAPLPPAPVGSVPVAPETTGVDSIAPAPAAPAAPAKSTAAAASDSLAGPPDP
jgi:monofunctional biosynthetic peptidoglycan transglycosylase